MHTSQGGHLELVLWASLQCYEAARWRRGWRLAALIPLPLVAGFLGVVVAGAFQSTDLWPLVIGTAAPLALSYCLLLLPVRKLMAARGPHSGKSRLLYLLVALVPAVRIAWLLLP